MTEKQTPHWNQEWCRWYNIIVGNNPFNVSDLRFSFSHYKGNVSSWVCVIFPEIYLEIYGTLAGSVRGGWSASAAWWSSWTDRWACRAVHWRTAPSARHKYSHLTGFSAGSGGAGAGLGTTAADRNGNTPVRGVRWEWSYVIIFVYSVSQLIIQALSLVFTKSQFLIRAAAIHVTWYCKICQVGINNLNIMEKDAEEAEEELSIVCLSSATYLSFNNPLVLVNKLLTNLNKNLISCSDDRHLYASYF